MSKCELLNARRGFLRSNANWKCEFIGEAAAPPRVSASIDQRENSATLDDRSSERSTSWCVTATKRFRCSISCSRFET